jgi:hypothetical protein
LVGSAALVAVTVTFSRLRISTGAEYSPFDEIVPAFGFNDQLTAVFDVLDTDALNCCSSDPVTVTELGLTVTEIARIFKENV